MILHGGFDMSFGFDTPLRGCSTSSSMRPPRSMDE